MNRFDNHIKPLFFLSLRLCVFAPLRYFLRLRLALIGLKPHLMRDSNGAEQGLAMQWQSEDMLIRRPIKHQLRRFVAKTPFRLMTSNAFYMNHVPTCQYYDASFFRSCSGVSI